jgi:hypothetical protein
VSWPSEKNADVEMMNHTYLKGTESLKNLPLSETASRIWRAMTESMNFRFMQFHWIGQENGIERYSGIFLIWSLCLLHTRKKVVKSLNNCSFCNQFRRKFASYAL